MNLESHLTQRERSTLIRFETWLTKLLNAKGHIFIRPVAFSAVAHTDIHGRITIDSGRMTLITPSMQEMESQDYILRDAVTQSEIARSNTLVKALLSGLNHAIERHFTDHHQAE